MEQEIERVTAHFYRGDMCVLTTDAADIARGYLIGPDGYKVLLSPKNKPGYQYTYHKGAWAE